MKESKFICPYCFKAFSGFEALESHVLQEHPSQETPKPENQISLFVNGREYSIEVEPQWTLNFVIHDKLGFTSTKMFCNRGACGSCTLIMEGKPILSCMTLAIECNGKSIVTAEGIAESGHPLIEAYVENHAMQCGYCTPGFVTTAKALLDRNHNPTEEEIIEAISGNLCRCGTYPQHPKAILQASEMLREEKP